MQSIHNLNAAENLTLESVPTRNFRAWIGQFRRAMAGSKPLKAEVERVMRSTWADEIQAADRHYQPGKFTTFAAYEFSTTKPDGGSLHRNVVFRGTDNLPGMPLVGSIRWTQKTCGTGWTISEKKRALGVASIPHNSNKSNGQMFALTTWAGDPMTLEHNEKRLRNEPLVEITQVKGIETHPALSMNDEWAGLKSIPMWPVVAA